MGRFVGRENVRKRLAAFEGEQGRTIYAGGTATIELPHETVVVRPPFGLAHEGRYETVQLTPLFAALAADHIVAALLIRLGGYAIGVFDGERIVAAKVGARFVKSRHKKGGSSANRFRRRREDQARVAAPQEIKDALRGLSYLPLRSRDGLSGYPAEHWPHRRPCSPGSTSPRAHRRVGGCKLPARDLDAGPVQTTVAHLTLDRR